MVGFGKSPAKSSNAARYVYDSPDPRKAEFIGRWKDEELDPDPSVGADARNRCVALSQNNKNDYPPFDRIIKPADLITDNEGKLIGYAFRYR